MTNPYEAPRSSGQAGASDPASDKIPITAYVLAVISGLFVTFGTMIFVAFSHIFFGDWAAKAPRPLIVAIPFGALGLGILSGWQSLRQAKKKVMEKVKGRTG
jgi:hypothetical protein